MVLIFIFLTLQLTAVALACNPAYPTICQAYSRAEAVFVGTLLRVDKDSTKGPRIDAQFAVEKVYKGAPAQIETVRFIDGDCWPQIKKIGEKYFVYKDASSSLGIGNRSHPFFPHSEEVKYAESLPQRQRPLFSIGGLILRLEKEELENITVEITHNSGLTHRIRPDKNGRYEFTTEKMGDYTVRIKLPAKRSVWTEVLNTYKVTEGNTLEYTLKFKPNECDYRNVGIDGPF